VQVQQHFEDTYPLKPTHPFISIPQQVLVGLGSVIPDSITPTDADTMKSDQYPKVVPNKGIPVPDNLKDTKWHSYRALVCTCAPYEVL